MKFYDNVFVFFYKHEKQKRKIKPLEHLARQTSIAFSFIYKVFDDLPKFCWYLDENQ